MARIHDSISDMPITAKSENRNSPVASGLVPMPAKAMMPMTVAPSSGTCVFFVASSAAAEPRLPCNIETCIPSATTMALSTSIPMAMISAPSEMRSISIEKIAMKNTVPITVSSSVAPTTTAARQPIASASTTTTMATEVARFSRKAFDASSTTTCCW